MSLIERPSRWCVVCLAGFAVVSLLVVIGATASIDVGILRAIGPSREPVLINIALMGQVLGDGEIEIPLAILLALLFWRLGYAARAGRYLLAAASCQVVYLILKPLFHRARPEVIPHLGAAGWYSFPSGHAMLAPVLWGMGLLLLARSITHPAVQRMLQVLAILLPAWIACSRVYLGVHYPSDVVAGALLGAAWVLLWREPVPPSSSSDTSAAPATR